MRYRERGLALVTILFFLAILMVLALMLSDKVLRATRGTYRAATRDQALQAAAAGIEWARHQLAATYRATSGWSSYLAASTSGTNYPENPAFSTEVGFVSVDIYLRDNPDGDDDPRRDNDLKLFVLSRARTVDGAEILVEGLCGFIAEDSGYRQWGEDARRSGQTAMDGPDMAEATLITFPLH